MTTTIFTAIDDQEHSGWATDVAIEIAGATSAMLIFFMANPAVLPGRGPIIYRWSKDYIDTYFNKARVRARLAGIYDTKCITKNAVDIAKSILLESQHADADYVVIGSGQRRGLFENWWYSISRDVVAQAHCPTVVVHSHPRNRTAKTHEIFAAE